MIGDELFLSVETIDVSVVCFLSLFTNSILSRMPFDFVLIYYLK
jgi:hypothetical protein